MSGGSYDYLYLRTEPSSIGERYETVGEMRDRILELAAEIGPGKAGDLAAATEMVRWHLEEAARVATGLSDVWHAVEWLDSGDYGVDQVREAVDRSEPMRLVTKRPKEGN